MLQNKSKAVIFADNSSAILTMRLTHTPDPVVALAAHSAIAAIAVSWCGNYATTHGVDKTLCTSGSSASTSRRRNRTRATALRMNHMTPLGKIDVVAGNIGNVAVVRNAKRWKSTSPTSRTVASLPSRTSDDASLETANEPVIGSVFDFHETISRTSIVIDWNHIVIERIRSKMNYMRIRNKSENGPLISEIGAWKFQSEGRQD